MFNRQPKNVNNFIWIDEFIYLHNEHGMQQPKERTSETEKLKPK